MTDEDDYSKRAAVNGGIDSEGTSEVICDVPRIMREMTIVEDEEMGDDARL